MIYLVPKNVLDVIYVIYGMIYLVPLDVINMIYVIYGVWFLNKGF